MATMKTNFYNRDGSLTRYALACGYVQSRTLGNVRKLDAEAYVQLEQICSNGALRVFAGGRYLRKELYAGMKLSEARRVLRAFKLKQEHEAARDEYLAALQVAS